MEKIISLLDTFYKERNFADLIPYVVSDDKLCKNLFLLVKNQTKYPYSEYASWIITHLAKSHPELVKKHEKLLIDILFESTNQSVLRNCVASLIHFNVSEYREVELLDLLVNYILDNNNKVALHVYSLYLMVQFIKKYPELKHEIDQILAVKIENCQPSFKAAIKKYHLLLKKY